MTEFSELGLSPATLQAVADTGYTTATPIQAEAIPHALTGRDVLGIAQTGTGKTAAFTLPMIDRLKAGRSKARMPRALVIAPTRELADQVAASFEKYAKGQKLSWALLIGGVSFSDQELKLDRGVDVVIATPGRLLDHFERGKLLMTGVQIMVVDEADRMLDMGFIPDLERIFKLTPAKKQTLFFSATMPPEITRITKQFLNDPIRIEASRPATTADTITQYLLRIPTTDQKAKRTALRTLIARDDVQNGIVFCNRKSEVDIVAKSLKTHGFDAAPIHGDLDQSTRMRTLESFRNGSLKLLVASDVAARGLDIPAVSHVFNFDVPHHADDYVHRIGRTGRAGRLGEAFMITTPADARNLDKVLKLTGKMPEEITLDLDWENLKDEPRSGRGDRSGGRSGGRGERSSGGRRSEGRGPRGADRHHGETAAMEPVVPKPAAAPVAVAPTVEAQASAPAPAPASSEAPAPRSRHRRGPRSERATAPVDIQAEAVQAEAPVMQERDVQERVVEERAAPEPRRERRSEREIPQRDLVRREQPLRESRERDRGGRGGDRNRRGHDGDHENDRDGVVGFGSDVPAFLAKAPPPRPAED